MFGTVFSYAFGLFLLEITSRKIVFSMAKEPNVTLVFANVLFRHGDRTPIAPYPNDTYSNVSYWPEGWGQLTNIGKEQQYELGCWLRQRYTNFLPELYSPNDTHVRSTNVDRTLMSAECNLAGLYPPVKSQMWSKKIYWQPIPVHTKPESKDEVLAANKACPRYDFEYQKLFKSPDMQKYNKEHEKLYNYVSMHVGVPVQNVTTLEYIYDTLFVEKIHNFTLPNWTEIVYEQMKSVAAFSFTLATKTPLLKRLKIGPLLKVLVKNMLKKQNKTLVPDYKLMMYSGHDTTIANILMGLGVFDPQSPPYRSLVLIELWKDNHHAHYVTVNYRNSTTEDPYKLTVPGCEYLCPLEKFITLLGPVIPVDWSKECMMNGIFFDDFTINSLTIIALMISGILAVLLLVSMAFGITYWRKQKSSSDYFYHRLQQEVN